MAACSHQHPENIEGAVPERSRHAVDNEFTPIREQLAVAEPDDGRTCFGLSIFRSWRLIHIRSEIINPQYGVAH
jgi:hypothetical protein